jgi:hypothetical protein
MLGWLLGIACAPPQARRGVVSSGEDGAAGTGGGPSPVAGNTGDDPIGTDAPMEVGRMDGANAVDTAPVVPAQDGAIDTATLPRDAAPSDLPADRALPADVIAPDVPPPNVMAGLMAWWKFDEGTGTSAADSSGSGNTGTLNGGATWLATGAPFPQSNSALSFDGNNDFVSLTRDLAPILGDTSTLAFWIRTNQPGNDVSRAAPGVTGVDDPNTLDDIVWGVLDAAGGIGVAAGNANGVRSEPMNDNQWHHIMLTRDAPLGQHRVYIDGILSHTASSAIGPRNTPFSALGRITNGASLRASLDDVRVWNRVLEVDAAAFLARR